MNKSLSFLVFLFLSIDRISAQVDCNSGRYDQEIFSTVNISSDLIYGSNAAQGGGTVTLKLDVYEPAGDTLAQRPLIILAHGGSFVAGTKNDADVTLLCTRFAKRGYVCASIDYRLGVSFPPSQAGTTQAVFRAVQDMKAAIRFFRKDAATTNVFKIDPSIIFAGGSSAGAFTALHLAYLDEPSELPSQIDTTIMGGMEGNSGNPGYSSEINAVINLCGALGDKTWMQMDDEPLVSMHGTADQTVPYGTSLIYYLGSFPIMVVDGSYSIHERANTVGVSNSMYTFFGAGHVPYLSNAAYMDTTVRFVSNFLYSYLGCTPSNPSPLANTFPTTGIDGHDSNVNAIVLSPNPVQDKLRVQTSSPDNQITAIRILDMQGRIKKELNSLAANSFVLEREDMSSGLYFIEARTTNGIYISKIIWQ